VFIWHVMPANKVYYNNNNNNNNNNIIIIIIDGLIFNWWWKILVPKMHARIFMWMVQRATHSSQTTRCSLLPSLPQLVSLSFLLFHCSHFIMTQQLFFYGQNEINFDIFCDNVFYYMKYNRFNWWLYFIKN